MIELKTYEEIYHNAEEMSFEDWHTNKNKKWYNQEEYDNLKNDTWEESMMAERHGQELNHKEELESLKKELKETFIKEDSQEGILMFNTTNYLITKIDEVFDKFKGVKHD